MCTSLALACSVVAVVGAFNEWHTTEQTCGDDDEACMPHTHTQATMLLQMNHHLERDLAQHVSILETCPLEQFRSSLAWLLETELLLESNITNSAQTRYLELAEQQQCEVGPEWSVSQKPLVINVGDGTTATKWLDGVMKDLGFNTVHAGMPYSDLGLQFKPEFASTADVDKYDYVSDSPTSFFTWQLVQSHPNALFLMTMRDPVEWRDTRIKDHHSTPWRQQGSPCLGAQFYDFNGSHVSASTYVAYSAWAKCVIPEDQFIGAVNVFADENNDAEFVDKLIHALETHGLQKPDWKNRTARVRANVALS